jgi:hypothetical protein
MSLTLQLGLGGRDCPGTIIHRQCSGREDGTRGHERTGRRDKGEEAGLRSRGDIGELQELSIT